MQSAAGFSQQLPFHTALPGIHGEPESSEGAVVNNEHRGRNSTFGWQPSCLYLIACNVLPILQCQMSSSCQYKLPQLYSRCLLGVCWRHPKITVGTLMKSAKPAIAPTVMPASCGLDKMSPGQQYSRDRGRSSHCSAQWQSRPKMSNFYSSHYVV